MNSTMRVFTTFSVTLVILAAACHNQRVVTEPPPSNWKYCWWTLLLTPTPPDSVAMRFADAFRSTGQINPAWSSMADTAWAHAGPTPLEGSTATRYWSRAVAYRQQDTTRYRYYVGITGAPTDSALGGSAGTLRICGGVARAAALTGWRPSRDPNYQDSVPVWNSLR